MSSLSLHRLQHARRLGGLAAGTAVCSSALLCETVSDNYRARHKFSTVLSIDGFHSLQKKAKNDDPDDVSLNEAEDTSYRTARSTLSSKSADMSRK